MTGGQSGSSAALPRPRRRLRLLVWPEVRDDDLLRAARERLLLLFCLIVGLAALTNTLGAIAVSLPPLVPYGSGLLAFFLLLVVPLHFHLTRRVRQSAWLLVATYTAIVAVVVGATGGLLAGGAVFLLSAPVLAGLLLGLRAALAIGGAVILVYLGYFAAQDRLGPPVHGMDVPAMQVDIGIALVLATAGLTLMAGSFNRVVELTNRRMNEARDRAQRANAALQAMANTDALTGLPNRRHFFARAEAMLSAAGTAGQAFAIVVLDIDSFKAVNDGWGHEAGDSALRMLAAEAGAAVPEGGFLARIGGEEFALALGGGAAEDGAAVAARMRDRIAAAAVPMPDGTALRMTASLGLAVHEGPAEAGLLDRLLARADKAMYLAKRAGGNRISAVGEEGAVGAV